MKEFTKEEVIEILVKVRETISKYPDNERFMHFWMAKKWRPLIEDQITYVRHLFDRAKKLDELKLDFTCITPMCMGGNVVYEVYRAGKLDEKDYPPITYSLCETDPVSIGDVATKIIDSVFPGIEHAEGDPELGLAMFSVDFWPPEIYQLGDRDGALRILTNLIEGRDWKDVEGLPPYEPRIL